MFEFLDIMDNYEERKVDRFEKGKILVDTCEVNDSSHDYETAVKHPDYRNGEIVIVEQYDTREDAQTGHDKWVKLMTGKELPKELVDVSDCDEAVMVLGEVGSKERVFKKVSHDRKKKEE